jgi:hypothetical protein
MPSPIHAVIPFPLVFPVRHICNLLTRPNKPKILIKSLRFGHRDSSNQQNRVMSYSRLDDQAQERCAAALLDVG